jgi:hypothetical protein
MLAFLGISYLYFAVKALTVKEAADGAGGRWWLPGLPMLAWLLAARYTRWWSPRRREGALLRRGCAAGHCPRLAGLSFARTVSTWSVSMILRTGREQVMEEVYILHYL